MDSAPCSPTTTVHQEYRRAGGPPAHEKGAETCPPVPQHDIRRPPRCAVATATGGGAAGPAAFAAQLHSGRVLRAEQPGPSSTTTILGCFQVSLPDSNDTLCMLSRQRELKLSRPPCGSHNMQCLMLSLHTSVAHSSEACSVCFFHFTLQ